MLALAYSATTVGVDGRLVRVEADSAAGTPSFSIIGLPDRALGESRERVRAAICNSGFMFPAGRLLVNLAPADLPKTGPSFDLPLALALLAIDKQVEREALARFVVVGELALDGGVRAVSGVLPMAICAHDAGLRELIVPRENAAEAALVEGLTIYAVEHLADAVAIALGHGAKFRYRRVPFADAPECGGDFSEVRAQSVAKRALEIAAAGGHNVLLVGPPGCGKTMLAKRLPSILPSPSDAEALAVTAIHSAAGVLTRANTLMRSRPFRAPHHSATQQALVGGGRQPRPGEASLAHHGVLFLDELPEFGRATLEALRQPIEEGTITISRAAGTLTFPARFTLIVAMNPCPCGMRGSRHGDCRCDDSAIARYTGRLSGPLLDRIDLRIDVNRVDAAALASRADGESSSIIRARVEAARARQHVRRAEAGAPLNAHARGAFLREPAVTTQEALHAALTLCEKAMLSARAFDRLLRVARTIADLTGRERVAVSDVHEAIAYRQRH